MEQDLINVSLTLNKATSRAADVLAAEVGCSKAELLRRALFHYIGWLAAQQDGPEVARREATQRLIPPTGKHRTTGLELTADQSELSAIAARTLANIGGEK